MGWIALILTLALAGTLLRWRRVPRSLVPMITAALMLGSAGYALQGRPELPGTPVSQNVSARVQVDPGLIAFRQMIMPGSEALLAAADQRLQQGDVGGAVYSLIDAIRDKPADATLWTALGTALAAHDRGNVSPTSQFAFRRAMQLAPAQPGAPFFLGLAHINAGQIEAARPVWQKALALAPADAPYRSSIADRLAVIDAFLAMKSRAPG